VSSDITELVAAASRILAAAGHGDLTWGHASVRDPDGRGAWLKAAGWGLEEVTADRVHLAQQMLTQAFGGWPSWSDPEESLRRRSHIYGEGPVRAVWDYLVRSLGWRPWAGGPGLAALGWRPAGG